MGARGETGLSGLVRPCDLCGAADAELLLSTDRLDGPLVRCRSCGLVYVGRRERDFTFEATSVEKTRALGERVDALGIVDREVEAAEGPWRGLVHEDRLARLAAFGPPPARLLDVGCSSGEFLESARAAGYQVKGVEPDPGTSAQARCVRHLDVLTGTLADAAAEHDVVTMFHVIEHVGSPRALLAQARRLLAPGGVLAVETPTIDTVWFRLGRGRWRQLIPDHYFFFTAPTLRRLLTEEGFEPLHASRVGKPVSVRFAADRVRRVNPRLGRAVSSLAAPLADRTVRINPGDVMLVFARASGGA